MLTRVLALALLLCSCATTDPGSKEIEVPLDAVAVVRDPGNGRMLVADRTTPILSYAPGSDLTTIQVQYEVESSQALGSETAGMAFVGDDLWVGRGRGLLRMEKTSTGSSKAAHEVVVEGAQRLGPLTADGQGHLFVADTRAMRLYRVDGDTVELFARGLEGVTGLGHDGASLWVTDRQGVIGRWTEVGLADRVVLPGGLGGLGSPVFTPEGRMFVPSRQAKALLEVFPLKRPGTLTDSGEISQSVPQRFRIVVPNVPDIGQCAYDPLTRSLWVPSESNRAVRVVSLDWIDRR